MTCIYHSLPISSTSGRQSDCPQLLNITNNNEISHRSPLWIYENSMIKYSGMELLSFRVQEHLICLSTMACSSNEQINEIKRITLKGEFIHLLFKFCNLPMHYTHSAIQFIYIAFYNFSHYVFLWNIFHLVHLFMSSYSFLNYKYFLLCPQVDTIFISFYSQNIFFSYRKFNLSKENCPIPYWSKIFLHF